MAKQSFDPLITGFMSLVILMVCIQAHATELSLRIPEAAVNESIAALAEADALGISEYNNKWGVNKWWFQVDSAAINLIAGGDVDISAQASAQANIRIAGGISFDSSGSGRATLHGDLSLTEDAAGRRLTEYNIDDVSGVSVDFSFFPNFVEKFLSDVLEYYFDIFGPIRVNPGVSILPTIPENAIVSTTPGLTITDEELLVTLTPKRIFPDLAITSLSHAKVAGGYIYDFNATIKNNGDAAAQRNFKVTLFDGNPDTDGDNHVDSPLPAEVSTLGPPQIISILDKGATTSAAWQAALSNGIDHEIYAVVDSADTVLEYREYDNIMAVTVPYVTGDLDGNLCVDRLDLNIVLAAIRRGSLDLSLDLNSDGFVNIADARRLVTFFKNSRGAVCL